MLHLSTRGFGFPHDVLHIQAPKLSRWPGNRRGRSVRPCGDTWSREVPACSCKLPDRAVSIHRYTKGPAYDSAIANNRRAHLLPLKALALSLKPRHF